MRSFSEAHLAWHSHHVSLKNERRPFLTRSFRFRGSCICHLARLGIPPLPIPAASARSPAAGISVCTLFAPGASGLPPFPPSVADMSVVDTDPLSLLFGDGVGSFVNIFSVWMMLALDRGGAYRSATSWKRKHRKRVVVGWRFHFAGCT